MLRHGHVKSPVLSHKSLNEHRSRHLCRFTQCTRLSPRTHAPVCLPAPSLCAAQLNSMYQMNSLVPTTSIAGLSQRMRTMKQLCGMGYGSRLSAHKPGGSKRGSAVRDMHATRQIVPRHSSKSKLLVTHFVDDVRTAIQSCCHSDHMRYLN